MADRLTAGDYDIAVHCPRCAREVVAIIALEPVLTVPAGDPATIKIKMRSKAVEHRCDQGALFDDLANVTLALAPTTRTRRRRRPPDEAEP